MINHHYNYNDSLPRMIGIGLVKTLTRCMTYINYFEDKKIRVAIPFYLSLSGNESFLLDAYVDDIVDKRIELNVDTIPRGIITLSSINSNIEELSNPNMYISKNSEINGEFRKIVSKVKAVPISFNYSIDVVVMSELDIYKIIEKFYNMVYNYVFYNIDYFGIKLDCTFNLPDDFEIQIAREQSLETDTKKHIIFNIKVESYLPLFKDDTDDYIVCDNDDSDELKFLWEKGCKKKPTLTDNIKSIKRVNWKAYIWDNDYENFTDSENRKNVPPENF